MQNNEDQAILFGDDEDEAMVILSWEKYKALLEGNAKPAPPVYVGPYYPYWYYSGPYWTAPNWPYVTINGSTDVVGIYTISDKITLTPSSTTSTILVTGSGSGSDGSFTYPADNTITVSSLSS